MNVLRRFGVRFSGHERGGFEMAHLDIGQLVQRILADIQVGKLADGQRKLPAEPVLMERYQVTRYTLRQALKQLSNMGYTYQMHGIGTFVRQQQTNNSIALQHDGGLSEAAARTGLKLATKKAVMAMTTVADAEFLPEAGHLKDNEELIDIRRFRELDGQPYLMEHSYYIKAIVDTIPEEALYGSLFNYFEQQRDVNIGFIDQLLMSEPLPEIAGEFMNLANGAPSLVVKDETYLTTGKMLAFSKQYYDYRRARLFMVKKIR